MKLDMPHAWIERGDPESLDGNRNVPVVDMLPVEIEQVRPEGSFRLAMNSDRPNPDIGRDFFVVDGRLHRLCGIVASADAFAAEQTAILEEWRRRGMKPRGGIQV